MQKAKKAAEHYSKNKEAIKEKSKSWYKNLSEKEKGKIKEYQTKKTATDSVQKRSVTK